MKKIALSLLLIPALGHSQAIKQGGVSAANLLISSLTATGVGAPGTAGSATIIPVFNFNSQGQITAISSATAAPAAGSIAAGTLAGGVLLPSGNLTGVVASSVLPSTVAYTSVEQTFTAAQHFGAVGTTVTTGGSFQMQLGSSITASALSFSTSPTANNVSIQLDGSGGVQMLGTTQGSAAGIGFAWEIISTFPAVQQNYIPTTGVWVAIATMTLQPGSWMIIGQVGVSPGGTTVATYMRGAISTSQTAGDGTAGSIADNGLTGQQSTLTSSKPGPYFVDISVATTYYLLGQVNYSVAGGMLFNTTSGLKAVRLR